MTNDHFPRSPHSDAPPISQNRNRDANLLPYTDVSQPLRDLVHHIPGATTLLSSTIKDEDGLIYWVIKCWSIVKVIETAEKPQEKVDEDENLMHAEVDEELYDTLLEAIEEAHKMVLAQQQNENDKREKKGIELMAFQMVLYDPAKDDLDELGGLVDTLVDAWRNGNICLDFDVEFKVIIDTFHRQFILLQSSHQLKAQKTDDQAKSQEREEEVQAEKIDNLGTNQRYPQLDERNRHLEIEERYSEFHYYLDIFLKTYTSPKINYTRTPLSRPKFDINPFNVNLKKEIDSSKVGIHNLAIVFCTDDSQMQRAIDRCKRKFENIINRPWPINEETEEEVRIRQEENERWQRRFEWMRNYPKGQNDQWKKSAERANAFLPNGDKSVNFNRPIKLSLYVNSSKKTHEAESGGSTCCE
ncbi:uncharacterized protein IL334_002025 [Kwoniella shivajii]|uniref:Uncharacterized protein n=1 Tax=Kwoniella shivajii TaxID=564305 RepID=A0ABZ1CU75_9TREE|nr:hypothetical protein IL334_002025 [Kwoniella shivajii]